jgi:hypothetical protein
MPATTERSVSDIISTTYNQAMATMYTGASGGSMDKALHAMQDGPDRSAA